MLWGGKDMPANEEVSHKTDVQKNLFKIRAQ